MIPRAGNPVEYDLYPRNFTEARRALRCPQRKVTNARTVHLGERCMPYDRATAVLDVLGPPPGLGGIDVVVAGGMFDVHVLGGNVHVVLGSGWGNVLTVEPGAVERTTAQMMPGVKAHVYGLPVDRITGDTARLRWYPGTGDDPHIARTS